MSGIEYPTGRPKFFAYKIIRAMTKSRAVDDIGAQGFVLVSIVATTEDATRYKKAVKFWSNPLMQDCGIGSKKTFSKIRDKCVEYGWLEYENTGTRSPGSYFAKIPDHLFEEADGHTGEELEDQLVASLGVKNTPNATPNRKPIEPLIVNQSDPQLGTNPTPPSTLSLNRCPDPSPSPDKPPKPPKGGLARVRKNYGEDFESFWEWIPRAFPVRKQDTKGDIFKKWVKARKEGLEPRDICTACKNYGSKNMNDPKAIGLRRFMDPETLRDYQEQKAEPAKETYMERIERETREKFPDLFEDEQEIVV